MTTDVSDKMQFSVRAKVILFFLIVLLSLVFRYPTTPHEIGLDSYGIHVLANSVSEFGYAKWWLHPTSVIGWYPYSIVSSVPFVLSGISQCSGLDVELAVLLYSIILGFFTIFGAYLLAGIIWNNDSFKFLVTIVLSTTPAILTKTTWAGNARTLLIVLMPFFVYLLLKSHASFRVRFSILTFVTLALLIVTHHLIYFFIPIILSYLIIVIIFKLGKYIKSIRIPENIANFALCIGFLIAFAIPYFRRSLWHSDPSLARGFGSSSVYAWIFDMMLTSYVRYIGIMFIFIAGGIVYLLLKQDKKFEEWFLLLTLVCLTPLLYIPTYMKWFIPPFACLLIGLAVSNIAKVSQKQKRKYAISFVIILLLLSTIFAGYYQYLHFLNKTDFPRYVEEGEYVGALWMKDNINKDENMIVGDLHSTRTRVFAISEVPTLTGLEAADLAYGFIDPKKLEVKQVHSPYSVYFYFHDPYIALNHTSTDTMCDHMLYDDINNKKSRWLQPVFEFNVSYCVENTDASNKLTRSIQQIKNNIYDNGKIRVWDLEQGR